MTAPLSRPERPLALGLGILARVYQGAFARPFKSKALEHAFNAECSRRFAGQRLAQVLELQGLGQHALHAGIQVAAHQ